jgi:hypothetical protein
MFYVYRSASCNILLFNYALLGNEFVFTISGNVIYGLLEAMFKNIIFRKLCGFCRMLPAAELPVMSGLNAEYVFLRKANCAY